MNLCKCGELTIRGNLCARCWADQMMETEGDEERGDTTQAERDEALAREYAKKEGR